jgi:lipoprotein NlpD
LRHPQDLRAGRWVQLCQTKKLSKSSQKLSNPVVLRQSQAKKRWQWPTKGTIIKRFSLPERQKGIDIASTLHAPVVASAAGKVAYAGDGIPGYGKLLIIKHDDHYLSAYAHNLNLVVKEGQRVDAGQVIAKVGYLSRRKPGLHFEIRQYGRPIDPLRYLKQRTNRNV